MASCAIITVSDTRGAREDKSGDLAAGLLEGAGHQVSSRAWARDEVAAIRRAVRAALARRATDVMILTGGTGVSPRDRTPEAVRPLLDYELPGFGEMFRSLSVAEIGTAAWLSRAGAGVSRRRLVVYLPGSPAAVELALRRVLIPELAHLLFILGRTTRS
jgi:molybdenum cofactor biosynthesis protein B